MEMINGRKFCDFVIFLVILKSTQEIDPKITNIAETFLNFMPLPSRTCLLLGFEGTNKTESNPPLVPLPIFTDKCHVLLLQ